MAVAAPTKLNSLLERTALFTPSQTEQILSQHRQSGMSITDVVVEQGFAREEEFLEALAGAMGIPFVHVGEEAIDKTVLEKLPPKAIFQYNVIPLAM
jgi:ribulose kinase